MTLYISIGIAIVNLFFSRKENSNRFIETLSVLWICLVMGTSINCADYDAYEAYYLSGNIYFEPGYRLVAGLFLRLGISFHVFRFIVLTLSVLTIVYVSKKINSNIHLLLFFYLIYSIVTDTIQIRSTFGCALAYLGFFYLIKDKKIMFYILMIIATSFHVSFLFMMLIPLTNKLCRLRTAYKAVLFMGVAVTCVYIYLYHQLPPMLVDQLNNFLPMEKITYFEMKNNIRLVFEVFPVITYFVVNAIYANIKTISEDENVIKFARLLRDYGLICMILCPLLMFGSDNLRIVRYATYGVVTLFGVIISRNNIGKNFMVVEKLAINRWGKYVYCGSFMMMWSIGYQYFPGYKEIFTLFG